MAALIKQDSGADTDLEPGARGEFTVWAGERKIAEKSRSGFPSEAAIVEAVKAALE